MSSVPGRATRVPAKAYTTLRTPDELLMEIENGATKLNRPLSASISNMIRVILTELIVVSSPPYGPSAEPPKPTADTPETSSRGRPSRRQILYGSIPGGAESFHRGPPQSVNQSFSFSNEEPLFKELLPQVDQSTYDSTLRRSDRRRAAREAADRARVDSDVVGAVKAAEQAKINFDAAEARNLQLNRQARQAAKACEAAEREVAKRQAAETLNRQTTHNASKALGKDTEQVTSASDSNTALKTDPETASKVEQPATSGGKKHATSNNSPIVQSKSHTKRRAYTPAPSPKPKFPSRLSQTESAYTDQEWEEIHAKTTSTPSDTSKDVPEYMSNMNNETLTHIGSVAGKSGASIGTQKNTRHDVDGTIKDSIEIVTTTTAKIITSSTDTQVSQNFTTDATAQDLHSTLKPPSPTPSIDSTYGSQTHSQSLLPSQAESPSHTITPASPRIIKKPVGPSVRRSTRITSSAMAQASNNQIPALSQTSGGDAAAAPASSLGKRTHNASIAAGEVDGEIGPESDSEPEHAVKKIRASR
ncbi:predicted protein [Plenodomus lingam JN3]|uniref:Predicted protein n=1 Tax=Leptosphaeria maculans (strain JN3 / isolate v23.1.3 / race Av1-4-5-6-7-8) TaxID=985895 RepID=E4ZIN9_LEPMJ|nr:predicted protein [Plenodomus lingam JN3]CBX91060.1 predicted protein [Plenodomus lingam JN3]